MRFCVDYCQVSSVTWKDAYSVPRIDDPLDALNLTFSVSLTCWLGSGWWKCHRKTERRLLFASQKGLFEFNIMSYPLGCTMPQPLSNGWWTVLAGLHWQSCPVYVLGQHHCLTVGSSSQSTWATSRKSLRFQEAGLKSRPSVTLVGGQWPSLITLCPTRVSQLISRRCHQQFLGLANY